MAFTAPISVQQVLQAAFGESEKLQANNVVIFSGRATFYFLPWTWNRYPLQVIFQIPISIYLFEGKITEIATQKKILSGNESNIP